MGLHKGTPIYDDLVMTPYRTLDEVRNKALRNNNSKSSSKFDNQNVQAVEEEDDDDDETYPSISEDCFSVGTHGLICSMKDLGEKARWPRKNEKSTSFKDKSKWCAFHEDFGHMADNCIGLRREIGYLLSKGHFKEFLRRKMSRIRYPKDVPHKAAPPPPDAHVINFKSGGSDICGTSFSSTKRHAKETKLEYREQPVISTTLTNDKKIFFDEEDKTSFQDPHHDGLVITLFIANHYMRNILVDGGSTINIIQYDLLKKINIPYSEIVPRSSVLVGFNGETKKTMGDIKLRICIEGVNSYHKICVIDNLSCYNVILGRIWLHGMKVVASTYHSV
ncbi:uncharacterized protein LOC143582280 [Bidens hawaiensis]|uniref:uncharacterized protein LOC143582280 n=1 Tax=Bidens hawaiensis TaxID=980011 RepID=UPI00404AA580